MQYAIIKHIMDICILKYDTKYTIGSQFVCIDNLFKTVWLIIIYIWFEYLQVTEDYIIIIYCTSYCSKIIIFLFHRNNILVDQ